MAYEEQDYNKRAFEWPVWKSILPYLRPYQKTLLVILALNLACAAIDILMPLFQRYAIDHLLRRAPRPAWGCLPLPMQV